ncbi:MAG: Cof-like hydrolase [Candidatus Saccharibacteria bacterium]|nr:Cof-like hydrolase [Candidatus Saccharibacteria bacterium]
MAKPKLILTDLDGTLLMPDMSISPQNQLAIRNLHDAGITIAAVTGRGFGEVASILQGVGITGYGVFDGGAVVVDCQTGKELWSRRIPAAEAVAVIEKLLPIAHLFAYGQGDMSAEEARRNLPTTDLLSIWASVEKGQVEAATAELMALPNLNAHSGPTLYSPHHDGISITHKDADKYHGVQALLKLEHVPKESIVAIGDGNNDVPLFLNAGITFAMGNANDRLHALADFSVADVARDGWAEMVNDHILGSA